MERLTDIINRLPMKSDKFTRHSYLDFYERELQPFRNAAIVLEIGVHRGASLAVWHEYFPQAIIWGIDTQALISPDVLAMPRVRFVQGNIQHTDILALLGVSPDVWIDDGSHKTIDRLALMRQASTAGFRFLAIEDICDTDDLPAIAARRVVYRGTNTADDGILAFICD
jgi:hypothetical protein